MTSDRLVTPRHVLRSVTELRRRRPRRVLYELERLEPDLAEYLIDNLSQLHHDLARPGRDIDEIRLPAWPAQPNLPHRPGEGRDLDRAVLRPIPGSGMDFPGRPHVLVTNTTQNRADALRITHRAL